MYGKVNRGAGFGSKPGNVTGSSDLASREGAQFDNPVELYAEVGSGFAAGKRIYRDTPGNGACQRLQTTMEDTASSLPGCR